MLQISCPTLSMLLIGSEPDHHSIVDRCHTTRICAHIDYPACITEMHETTFACYTLQGMTATPSRLFKSVAICSAAYSELCKQVGDSPVPRGTGICIQCTHCVCLLTAALGPRSCPAIEGCNDGQVITLGSRAVSRDLGMCSGCFCALVRW